MSIFAFCAQTFKLADILALEIKDLVISGNSGDNALVVCAVKLLQRQIGADYRRDARIYTGIDDIVKRRFVKSGMMLRAKIVENEQIAAAKRFKRIVFALCSAEMLLFDAPEQIHNRAVDRIESVLSDLLRYRH